MMLRAVVKAFAVLLGVTGAYFLGVAFPDPLFPVATAHASVTFRARTSVDPSAANELVDSVLARISTSELYDSAVRHRVLIVGDRALWSILNGPYQSAIARNVDIGNAIFIPRLDAANRRIVHFDGRSTDAVGILSHEIMHTFIERRVGLKYWTLPWWKREGYAEYIGSARCRELDSPERYREAALTWKRLLEESHLTFDQIIALP